METLSDREDIMSMVMKRRLGGHNAETSAISPCKKTKLEDISISTNVNEKQPGDEVDGNLFFDKNGDLIDSALDSPLEKNTENVCVNKTVDLVEECESNESDQQETGSESNSLPFSLTCFQSLNKTSEVSGEAVLEIPEAVGLESFMIENHESLKKTSKGKMKNIGDYEDKNKTVEKQSKCFNIKNKGNDEDGSNQEKSDDEQNIDFETDCKEMSFDDLLEKSEEENDDYDTKMCTESQQTANRYGISKSDTKKFKNFTTEVSHLKHESQTTLKGSVQFCSDLEDSNDQNNSHQNYSENNLIEIDDHSMESDPSVDSGDKSSSESVEVTLKSNIVKKSRKQTVPKRYHRLEDLCTAENSLSNTENSVNELEHESKDVKVDMGRTEKSRKQSTPMRIMSDAEEVCESETCKNKELCLQKEDKSDKNTIAVDIEISEVSGSSRDNDQNFEHESENSNSGYDVSATAGPLDISALYRNSLGPNFDLKPMPGFGFHAENLGLYAKLSPSMLTPRATSNFIMQTGTLDELENIDVIRQLREIRCNKYRKISVAEKKEIAEFARSNGVSQAAGIYNVSKSAVSMWTRMDLDELEEQDEKRKKNCMLGNERFEKLCAKVREQKDKKFKGLSKSDKFEVSRYAKLVGVREMARCLDVALGTVSGWMRQFPYKVNTEVAGDADGSSQEESTIEEVSKKVKSTTESKNTSGTKEKGTKRKAKTEAMNVIEKTLKKENETLETGENDISESKTSPNGKTGPSSSPDDLDHMIAESIYKPPDVEKMYDEMKGLMEGTELEGNIAFKTLFNRVVQCKGHKYKTLSAADKMAVCRYGKQVGVRKVGRILGLATGTLSGWNSKYHVYLSSDRPETHLEFFQTTGALENKVGDIAAESGDSVSSFSNGALQRPSTSSGKVMTTEADKSEIMAVRCLLKDRFESMVQKIDLARSVKFKNITVEEKIDIVKCSKLVGIRPTARVLNIPIGTLSGWISKYSNKLHPVYNISDENSSLYGDNVNMFNTQEFPYPGKVNLPDASSTWGQTWPIGHGLNFPTSGFDAQTSDMYSGISMQVNEDDSQGMRNTDDEAVSKDSEGVHIKSEPDHDDDNPNNVEASDTINDIEEEARKLAQKYLQAAYSEVGASI